MSASSILGDTRPAKVARVAQQQYQPFQPGDVVRAKYNADGLWYEATVAGATNTGFAVVFNGYSSP